MTIREQEKAGAAAYDRQRGYDLFKKKYTKSIEHGYSLDDFRLETGANDAEIEQFKRLQQEIAQDEADGQAFLAGFRGVKH